MTDDPSAKIGTDADSGTRNRLDSWKDVAAYLKRDVSTVQRWERREGLPIHRHVHDKLGSIYAFRHELDAWQSGRTRRVGPDEPGGSRAETGGSSAGVAARHPGDTGLDNGPATPIPGEPAAGRRRKSRWLQIVAGLVLAFAAIAFAIVWKRTAAPALPGIASLVVLPFENLSADPTQAYVAAGLTEALTTRLAGIRALRVVSRTSAMAFEGRRVPLPAIAQELRVDAVLEGSIRSQNGRVKVAIQLIHAATDTHLWAHDFEADGSNLLQLESDVARSVADEVRVQITPEERARLAAVPPVDPMAHEEYLLGRYLLWKFIEQDRLLAIEHFQRAIRIAPDYAPPYAGLAHAWWMRGVSGPLSLGEVASPAREAAREALARDDRLAEAYAAQAYVQGIFDWEWARAEATIRHAVDLAPNSVDAHYVYALLLMALGRLTDSIVQIDLAARVDPLSAQVQSTFGRVLYRARRFDEAIVRLNRASELEPRNAQVHSRLADVYRQMGRHDEAFNLYEKAAFVAGSSTHKAERAIIHARVGRVDDARRILASLPSGIHVAAVHAALGDRDRAFEVLFRELEKREQWPLYIKADPDFDSLRGDPRWTDLLRRMRLESD